MPSKDKPQADHTVIQVAVAKNIGTETCTDAEVVIDLKIQGKAKVPDVELISLFDAIDLLLETTAVKQIQGAPKAGSKITGQMRFELQQRIILQ